MKFSLLHINFSDINKISKRKKIITDPPVYILYIHKHFVLPW